VITAVRMAAAGGAFLFDVNDFARAAYVTIPADDATAGERREPEEPNNTHLPIVSALFLASSVPRYATDSVRVRVAKP
jgi:hypothetical protein